MLFSLVVAYEAGEVDDGKSVKSRTGVSCQLDGAAARGREG